MAQERGSSPGSGATPSARDAGARGAGTSGAAPHRHAGSGLPEEYAHWHQVEGFRSLGVPVTVHKSTRTGLRVCVAQVKGPIVSGFFTLATEAVTSEYADANDGLPHTLEHMIFLGSELYPYKGVLDQLANRCLAGTDHTAYTLTTAGSDGFLNLMPIYIDHILYPTLSTASFMTEVHHIQEDGNDAGVVYSEMQARENTCDDITDRRLLLELYPNCGYSSETNGLLENLRSLSVDQVRRYHREFYRPDNLCIIVTGQVSPVSIFAALESVEARIVEKGPLPPMRRRPWSTPVAPLASLPEAVEVMFPSDDESTGRVLLGWRGPQWGDFEAVTALRVMWLYLTDSSVSALHRAFVELADPYCGNVEFHIGELSTCYHGIAFEDARADRMRLLRPRFMEVVAREADHVDLSRLAAVIARERRNVLNSVESHPHYTFAVAAISNALYGDSAEAEATGRRSLKSYLSSLERLDALPTRGQAGRKFWGDAMRRLLNTPCVAVIGRPSSSLADANALAERLRVEKQRRELGPVRLAELGQQLARATSVNERPPPAGLLESVPVPSLSSLSAIPVVTVRHWPAQASDSADTADEHAGGAGSGAGRAERSGGAAGGGQGWHTVAVQERTDGSGAWRVSASSLGTEAYCPPKDRRRRAPGGASSTAASQLSPTARAVVRRLSDDGMTAGTLPIWVQWDHVETAFVTITAALDTQGMPSRLRPFCALVTAALLELPVRLPDGTMVEHHQVVSDLMADSVSTRASLGVHGGSLECGAFPQMMIVTLTFEARKYTSAVQWLKRLLLYTKFTPERLRITVNKLLAQIPTLKRSGEVMAQELMRFELYDSRSNHTATNIVRQQRFLDETNARLAATPAEVVREVEEFRAFMTQPHRMRFHVACDVFRVDRPAMVWIEQFANAFRHVDVSPLAPVTHAKSLVKPGATIGRIRGAGAGEGSCGRLAVLPSSETSYLVQATSSISSFMHEDYPAMMVAIEYLTALEGDFWRKIRGLGLAYSYNIKCSPESGLLRFALGQATDVVAALQVARDIVDGYVNKTTRLSDVTLEAAKSSVVFSLVSREATVEQAGFQSFKNALRGVVAGHNQRLVHRVAAVTRNDVLRMLHVYFKPLFDPSCNTVAVTTAVSKGDGVNQGLAAAGCPVRNVGKLDDWFCVGMARRGAGRNRSIGGAASPDFEPSVSPESGSDGARGIAADDMAAQLDVVTAASPGASGSGSGGSTSGTGSASGSFPYAGVPRRREGTDGDERMGGSPHTSRRAAGDRDAASPTGSSSPSGRGAKDRASDWWAALSRASVSTVVVVGLATAAAVLAVVWMRRRRRVSV